MVPTTNQTNNAGQQDALNSILWLLHDPLFVDFELQQEAPSVFRAVGRTHTETWHSALLGWLLNPGSSHDLGLFPLQRFILLIKNQNQAATHGIDLDDLLVNGDL
ncbi:MAG: PD-(D/E)XK nuclease family protein, partial [Armatimonadetes bacterium]|nr:PD-(D/E)XK nuclease family protein [Armatimonadota bacterium]